MTLAIEQLGDVTRWRMQSLAGRVARITVSAYVYRGLLIDTGFHHARRSFASAMSSASIRGVIVTHWHEDHAGNAVLVSARRLPMWIAPKTEAILRARPRIQLYRRLVWGRPPALRGDVVPLNDDEFECIHTPGHSEDHHVVWFPDSRTLFSGDLWLGVRSRVFHASEDPYRIVETLRRVAELDPTRMFDSHRGLITSPAEALLARADWLTRTLDDIAGQIAEGRSDAAILEATLRGEEMVGVVSRGEYSRRNLIAAVRRRVAAV